MTDEVAKVGIGIVGDDRTDKAFKSVEKRAKQSQKRVGDINRNANNDNQRHVLGSTKSIIGSMAKVEKATARAFGGKSLTSALSNRLSGLTEASAALGEGFAGASVAGSGLAVAVGSVAVAAGATVAVLGVAAYAAMKFGNSWAKGASQLSRTAEVIGVSTKALSEFNAAAARVGVSEGSATGAIGGLSQTLNDARYGRNVPAMEVLRRSGVGMQLNKDGTVNTEAMLPAIADAIQRQGSSGRRTIAQALGIPLDALPAFSQGGKALSADMQNTGSIGLAITDKQGQDARVAARKAVLAEQNLQALKNQAGARVSAAMSGNVADAWTSATGAFNAVVNGDFKTASKKLSDAGTSLDRASLTFDQQIWRATDPIGGHIAAMGDRARIWGSGATPTFGSNPAKQAGSALEYFREKGWSKTAAAGIAANLLTESQFNPRAVGDNGQAYGAAQWHPDRQANFRRVFGHDIRKSTYEEQLNFVDWELRNTHKAAGDALRRAGSASEAGAIVSRLYEAPKAADFEAARRGDLADSISQSPSREPHPVKVEIEVKNGKAHKVKTTSGKGAQAAVSHAMVN